MQKILGSALKREREVRDIPLAHIAQEMNISRRFLQALEDEEFDQIHGDFYVRQYIRSYLRAVGADETDFFNRYQDYLNTALRSRSSDQPVLYFDKIRFSKFRRRRIYALALAAILLVSAAVYLFTRFPQLSPASLWRRWQPPAVPLLLPVSARAGSEVPTLAEPDFPALKLELLFSRRCWAQVVRGGDILLQRQFEPGQKAAVEGYELGLFLGDPTAAELRLNGLPFPEPKPQAGPLRLTLTPEQVPSLNANE